MLINHHIFFLEYLHTISNARFDESSCGRQGDVDAELTERWSYK